MKRWFISTVVGALAIVAIFGVLDSSRQVGAQDNRTLNVNVSFGTEQVGEDGAACGLDEVLTANIHPRSRQVIVTDASGDIVGKVDLYNALSTDLPNDADRPGTLEHGMCFVRSTIEIPDSDFYTFTIRGEFEWTMSRSELEDRDWQMPVYFNPGD